MLNRRYPHVAAGKWAAPFLAAGGAAGGVVAAALIPGAPPMIANAILWAVLGGVASFTVFGSEGPRERPPVLWQAVVADGVVSGMLTGLTGVVVDLVASGGAGSASGSSPSALTWLASLGLALAGGAALGSVLGLVVLLTAGREILTRASPQSRSRAKRNRTRRRKKR